MEPLLRLALIGTACFLTAVLSVLLFRYRKVCAKKGMQMGREEVLGRLFLRKLHSLGEGEEEPAAVLKKLSGLMRTFFSELFDISYEFDYVELNEELSRKGVDEDVRKGIIDYSMKAEEFQYGGKVLTGQDLSAIVEKSVMIIRAVTERKQEKEEPVREKTEAHAADEEEPGQPAQKKPGRFSGMIDGIVGKPAQTKAKAAAAIPDDKTLQDAEKNAPPEAVPPADEKPQKPAPDEAAGRHKHHIPPAKEDSLQKIRKLLLAAENALSAGSSEDAMESYGRMREIYEELPQDEKRQLSQETQRMITLYNRLLNEYRDALSPGSSGKDAPG